MHVYKRGFASALSAIALAFGLEAPPLHPGASLAASSLPALSRQTARSGSPGRALSPGRDRHSLAEVDLGGLLRTTPEVGRQRG